MFVNLLILMKMWQGPGHQPSLAFNPASSLLLDKRDFRLSDEHWVMYGIVESVYGTP